MAAYAVESGVNLKPKNGNTLFEFDFSLFRCYIIKLVLKFHRCWQKIGDSWVQDQRPHYLWLMGISMFVLVPLQLKSHAGDK